MLSDQEISQRNGRLIGLISALDLGIHILDLPHKPKLISPDYNLWFNGYVKNFDLILMSAEPEGDIYLKLHLDPIKDINLDELKPKFLYWMFNFVHKKIYTLSLANTSLFVVGFNHHNKIEHKNPFPVFADFYPLTYMTKEKAREVKKRFSNYDLIVK